MSAVTVEADLLRRVATHPDPWFSALAEAHLRRMPDSPGGDPALAAHLEAQAVSGTYEPPDVEVTDTVAPGPHGEVLVRVYRPHGRGRDRPLVVWNHGGGWVGGDLDMPEADATAREVCVRAGAVVVSVGYRLAVFGVHFPVPHDDVVAAVDWARRSVDDLGAHGCLVVGGASAGANLAAGAVLRLRDEGRAVDGALLVYPLVHPVLPPPSDELAGRLAAVPERHAFTDLTALVENYLGGPVASASPYAMPGLGDLSGFPPTLVINDEYDGLRASGEAFAAALSLAGAPVQQLLATGVLHGHLNSPWLPQARQTHEDMSSWIRSLQRARP